MITTRIKSKHKCNVSRTGLALAASEKIRRAESFASEKHRRFGAPNLFARGQHKGSALNYNTTSIAIYCIRIEIIFNLYVMCSLIYLNITVRRFGAPNLFACSQHQVFPCKTDLTYLIIITMSLINNSY